MHTPEQENYLVNFCEEHFVRSYDVRLAIASDMAKEVTDKMNTDVSLSFETAVQRVYESYGVTGFSKAIEAKENKIHLLQKKMKWELFKKMFTPKNIAILLIAIIVFIITLLNFKTEYVLFGLVILSFVLITISFISVSKRKKLFSKQQKELSITLDAKTSSNFSLYAIPIPILVIVQIVSETNKEVSIMALAFLFIIIIYGIIDVVVTSKYVNHIYQMAKDQYPEAFIGSDNLKNE